MSEWIKAEDRLPEYWVDVWAWVEWHGGSRCGTETWLEDDGQWAMGSAKGFNVTHWMPLPEPPE